jgi:DNA-binding protein HU-beta
MTRKQLIEQTALRAGITESQSEAHILAIQDTITKELKAGGSVSWHGLGKWSVSHRKSHLGINPQTLTPMTIPALKTVKYVAGEPIKKALR